MRQGFVGFCLMAFGTAAGAQDSGSSWRAAISIGPAIAGATAQRTAPSVTRLVLGIPGDDTRTVTDSYFFDGPVIDVAAERRISVHRSVRVDASLFHGGGDLEGGCIEDGCSIRSRAFAVSSMLTIHRANEHRWGPSLGLGMLGMQVRQAEGNAAGAILGTGFGPAARVSFSFGAFHHVAPVVELRESLLLRMDGHAMETGALGLFLQTR
jgi:hypothetical protein